MFKEIRFALYAIKKNIQSSAELRTSFLMNVFGMAINNTSFIIIWIYFVKSVGVINGWTAADIVGLQGFVALSYGIVATIAMGIRKLPDTVASGAFDRFMLSPKNLLLRVATSAFNPSGVGDIIFGVVCLVIYTVLINADLYQIMFLLIFIVLTTALFLATLIAIYATSFFFMDSSAVTNGLFDVLLTPALFHGGAFQGVMRFVFTFAIPSLLLGALPVEAIRGVSVSKLILITVLTIVWWIVSVTIFNKAVKKYESSNFMTFGN